MNYEHLHNIVPDLIKFDDLRFGCIVVAAATTKNNPSLIPALYNC